MYEALRGRFILMNAKLNDVQSKAVIRVLSKISLSQ